MSTTSSTPASAPPSQRDEEGRESPAPDAPTDATEDARGTGESGGTAESGATGESGADARAARGDEPPSTKKDTPAAKGKWRRRIKRAFLALLIATPILGVVMWILVHTFPGVGPVIADGLRAVIGTDGVAWIEETVYGAEDRWNQFYRSDEAPKTYWEVPEEPVVMPAPTATAEDAEPRLPPFRPDDVGPMLKQLKAEGDGRWVPVADPARPSEPPAMFKTLIHPDAKRPWAELFVVAIDLRVAELHSVAGSAEPTNVAPGSRDYERPAMIPSEHHDRLLAGFNGGFKTEHGHWGYRIGGHTIVPARKHGCTITKATDGTLTIAPWPEVEKDSESFSWWRQTPPCMYHQGERHAGLWHEETTGWGAAIGGESIIRRSALGLSADKQTLFVSVSNHTSAQAIANAMHHAGAVDVAQLDVNWSFPRFVTFPVEGGKQQTTSLFPGFDVDPDDYLRKTNPRDFFYVTRTDLDAG